MKLSEIRPYESNPRINDSGVDKVAASIKEFGFRSPIIVDRDHVILAGHTRYKAAQKLGLQDVPVIVADDLTDEQARAYRLADNKTAEFSGWDFNLLDAELDEILSIDMSDFGFVSYEEPSFDDAPEPSERTEPEDWQITLTFKSLPDYQTALEECKKVADQHSGTVKVSC